MKEEFMKKKSAPKEFIKAMDIFLANPNSDQMKDIKILLEEAALKGYAPAQYYLYSFLWLDSKSMQDKFTALEWCEKAACAGCAPAQYDYALHHLYGDCIRYDVKEAAAWLERAATQEYIPAMQKLHSLYYAGNRIEQNKEKAAFWKNVESGQINIRKNVSLSKFNFAKEMTLEYFQRKPVADIPSFDGFVYMPIDKIILSESFESFAVDISNREKIAELISGKLQSMFEDGLSMEHIYVVALNDNEKKFIQENLPDDIKEVKELWINTFGSLLNSFKMYIAETAYSGEPNISMSYINSLAYKDRLAFINNFLRHNPDVAEKCVYSWEYAIFTGVEYYNKEKLMILETVLWQLTRRGCGYIILCDENFRSCEVYKNRNFQFVYVEDE